MSAEGGEQQSFHIRLIEAVRQQRCLYDSKDPNYRNSEHKAQVWDGLVAYLGFKGLHLLST